MSKCIAKSMYLKKLKLLIFWDGGWGWAHFPEPDPKLSESDIPDHYLR